MDGLRFKSDGEVVDYDGNHVGFHNEDSTILAILAFDDKTGNADLDSQIDENAIELFERKPRFSSLEEILAELKLGIYGK